MKNLIKNALLVSCLAFSLAACSTPQDNKEATSSDEVLATTTKNTPKEESIAITSNFTDEMKIPYTVNIDEYGANYAERGGDHVESPYFISYDYYNMTSHGSLAILPKFKTQQQTSEWSCGLSALLMVMDYYGVAGDHNEETLAELRFNGQTPGPTKLEDMVKILELHGLEVDSTYNHAQPISDYLTLDKIRETVTNGQPILICWSDWGGHWQTIIGYDTLGTETYVDDVLIVADSYDTSDHNQDGYGVFSAERFWYNFTVFDFLETRFAEDGCEEREFLFAIVSLPN